MNKPLISLIDTIAGFVSGFVGLIVGGVIFSALANYYTPPVSVTLVAWPVLFSIVFYLIYVGLSFRKSRKESGAKSYIYSLIFFFIGFGVFYYFVLYPFFRWQPSF